MPHVTVIFNPKKISQGKVNEFKVWLQGEVSRIMSSDEVRCNPGSRLDITTTPDGIAVFQQLTHPTDINVLDVEVKIDAGRPKGRSASKIASMLVLSIKDSGHVPANILNKKQCGVFIMFHPKNGFKLV